MSEYIEIVPEATDDPAVTIIRTNLQLTESGVEIYDSPEALEEGSPLAQMLASVEGIRHVRLADNELTVTRDLEVAWHSIVADVTAVLKDFFL